MKNNETAYYIDDLCFNIDRKFKSYGIYNYNPSLLCSLLFDGLHDELKDELSWEICFELKSSL